MPTDRATLQRGLPSSTQDQDFGPGRRLPSARRERKPALAAFALLLIVGGALAAGLLVIASGKRVAAIEISQQVGVGQQIPLAAMQQVQVASGTGLAYVPWAEASQVARFYAAVTIPPGTLLTSTMVAQASGVTAGKDIIGLALKDGQWPDQLKAGDHVGIYAVSSQSSASAGCPGSGGTALAGNATVVDVVQPGANSPQAGATDVSVAVNPADAGAVACDAAAGNVAVVVLPTARAAARSASAPATTPAATPSPSATSPTPARKH
ncbi:MAG TPA: hypothetical protein VIX86_11675 [Streptosporangiaceae bacterium]